MFIFFPFHSVNRRHQRIRLFHGRGFPVFDGRNVNALPHRACGFLQFFQCLVDPVCLDDLGFFPLALLRAHSRPTGKIVEIPEAEGTTKPDTDNLQKLLKDVMTDLGFWKDDALVASEIVEKFWAERPGIFIYVETLP